MNSTKATAVLVSLALGVAGCASTPRGFSPIVRPPPVDQAAFDAAFNQCAADVAAGRRENFRSGRTGSALGGAAVAGGAGVALGASAASGAGMLSGTAAGVGLLTGLILVAPLGFYGVSRIQRANKEREIRDAMTACLHEEGYEVADWRLLRRGETGLSSPTRAAPSRP